MFWEKEAGGFVVLGGKKLQGDTVCMFLDVFK